MKKMFVAATSLVVFVMAGWGQSARLQSLVGDWSVVGEQDAALQVIDSSTIILTYMGQTKKLTDYSIDFSRSPWWFDFSASDGSSIVHVKSLLKVDGDNILKWQLFIDEDRPPYFTTDKGELFYLKRSKPKSMTATAF
jgi:hypothetical protein